MSAPSLEIFHVKYLGFSPTDESAIGIGEMEVIISDDKIKIRMATGLKISEEEIDISEFDVIAPEDAILEFASNSVKIENVVGELRHKRSHPKLIFLRESPQDDFGALVITGGMGDMLGPTALFGPAQVEKGQYADFLRKIEEVHGQNVFPRLSSGGRAKE